VSDVFTIDYMGNRLDVVGSYTPEEPGDFFCPPSDDFFEVERIELNAVELKFLTEEQREEITELVIEQIRADADELVAEAINDQNFERDYESRWADA
jgi:hypothetical protein